ncbi:DUF3037 domain-containing protein [Pedobacter gandavensis]|uniref:DUF3037 domain-containing protein n=1 Tax=Pedobacter TaxID=84567 RepID=UPI001C98EA9C|nr:MULTISPECIES: DUF3037 domain-containing protein [Pedobacter]WGQ10379.1 DUF3037 domain-containing protein [Pedobacter gandavensis]
MQEKHLFEYAVIRVVPRVEREEFLNVGIILYCAKQKFLQTLFELDEGRLAAFSCKLDPQELLDHLRSFELISKGGKAGGTIGQLDMASRFRWLTATRSTVVQTSKTHPGLCLDAQETLKKLYEQLVL